MPTPDTPLDLTKLAQLQIAGDLPEAQLRLHSRRIMIILSHAIEQQAAASGPGTIMVAAFQRLSLLRPEAQRYTAIAPRLTQAFALGVPDIEPPELPGVTIVPIEAGWPLAQEWLVIASGPDCCAALLSRDAEGFDMSRRSRRFHGRWTTDPGEVDAALGRFYTAIGQPLPHIPHEHGASLHTATTIRQALARIGAR